MGHRRIAFLQRISITRAQVDPDSLERQAGFQEAYRRAGLPLSKGRVFSCLSHDAPVSAVFQAVSGPRAPFTALLCADGGLAAQAREAARACGKRIPEDLSIASFQRRAEGQPFSGPSVDFFDLGRRAVQLLACPPRPARVDRVPAVWQEADTEQGVICARPSRRPHPSTFSRVHFPPSGTSFKATRASAW